MSDSRSPKIKHNPVFMSVKEDESEKRFDKSKVVEVLVMQK